MPKWVWGYVSVVAIVELVVVAQNLWDLSRSDWASWVQAIGSIAAIFGAYLVGERQSNAALASVRESHRLAEDSKRESRFAVLQAAYNRASDIRSAVQRGEPPLNVVDAYHASILDGLILAMNNIPASELGAGVSVDAFIIFSGQFVFLREAMEKYVRGPFSDPDFMARLEELRSEGYGREHEHEMIMSARHARKMNVLVHLDRIDIEFKKLRSGLGDV
ncbi:hypothetical protein [Burkholderia gladioli]|uniref:hypothetical protein n=1 Tax=Burkholderia gladioli TaxID=28095 RepID=UPI00163F3696|nr:hypothetical protein [Burkholderia gladioli]